MRRAVREPDGRRLAVVRHGQQPSDGRHIDATIQSGFVSASGADSPAEPSRPKPTTPSRTVGGAERTIDGGARVPGDIRRTAGNLDKTLDSAVLPPGGVARPAGNVDQTLDSSTLPPGRIGPSGGIVRAPAT